MPLLVAEQNTTSDAHDGCKPPPLASFFFVPVPRPGDGGLARPARSLNPTLQARSNQGLDPPCR